MDLRALSLCLVVGLGVLVAPPRAHAQDSVRDDESEIYVEEARRAFAQKRYAQAAQLLEKALAENPRRIDAYILRAAVHAVKKEFAAGVALLRRAHALAPGNPHVMTALGTQLILAHQPDEGVPLLVEVASRWPERYEAHASLGHHYERVGKWPEAVTSLRAYFASRPASLSGEDTTHELSLSNALLRSGDAPAALSLYRKVLAHDEDNLLGRMGVAWATAATDCAAALPLLRDMRDESERYPELLLVEGRCSIALGKVNEALALATRYSKARPKAAEGWALLGEARLAAGDLEGARVALGKALARAPGDRLVVLRLARVERRVGQPAQAAGRLRGQSAPPGYEEEWAVELGEALLDDRRADEAVAALAPFLDQQPGSAAGHAVMGVARLERNEIDVAIVHLEKSLALDPKRTRARGPLQQALNRAATLAFAGKAYGKAEAQLVRAAALGDDATTLRNLGGVRLLAGNPGGALEPLEKSAALATDPRTLALLGRAYKQSGKLGPAAGALRQALKLLADDPHALDLRVDLAAVLLADGKENEALQVIGPALADKDATRRARALDAFVVAGRATATEWMRVGAFERAFSLLEDVEETLGKGGEQAVAVRCDLALAATGAGLRDTALRRLAELEKDKAVCPFVPPADKLAVPILIAWNEGATPAGAERALRRLEGLRKLATGAARPLVREAARFIALRAAAELFGKNPAQARGFLARAARYEDATSPETTHNQAVLALEDGNLDAAIAGLESVVEIVPEASVNLGIAWERKGDPQKALAYFRRAAAAGARFLPLKRWIAVKERIWGGGGT